MIQTVNRMDMELYAHARRLFARRLWNAIWTDYKLIRAALLNEQPELDVLSHVLTFCRSFFQSGQIGFREPMGDKINDCMNLDDIILERFLLKEFDNGIYLQENFWHLLTKRGSSSPKEQLISDK
ncbi:unnamed protein product [Protopolystoma xenopodis]|uniref:Uncharacterized protein n=1 Tax=Protopolystoma xenopodis TaxID=117903 RepID=A0A448X3T4_9PLAT|nr:unnamed protein product [Protopolystoma xenopodis]